MDAIILRKMKYEGDPFAVILNAETNPGMLMCYAVIGQHSECSEDLDDYSEPASRSECRTLLADLRAVGYRPMLVTLEDYLEDRNAI